MPGRERETEHMPTIDTTYSGERPPMARIPLDQLQIDRDNYQREPSEGKVRAIARRFEERSAGALQVSVRQDGSYWVMDGQHRLLALRYLGRPDALCMLWYDLKLGEEAIIFAESNTLRAAPRASTVYRARLLAGERDIVEIDKILKSLNIRVISSPTGASQTATNVIWATRALERIYADAGAEGLRYVLGVAQGLWGQQVRGLGQDVLLGIHLFVKTYRRMLEREWYSKFTKVPVDAMYQEAVSFANLFHTSRHVGFARALLTRYNAGKRSGRLDDVLRNPTPDEALAADVAREENEGDEDE